MTIAMTSNRPYLIRAMYDWIVDNDLTPYLLVNTDCTGVEVPEEHVSGGRIILNISPKASRGLHLNHDSIIFSTRFSGKTTQIVLVPQAVLAIYAKENGRGMEFGEAYDDESTTAARATPAKASPKKPFLKLVE